MMRTWSEYRDSWLGSGEIRCGIRRDLVSKRMVQLEMKNGTFRSEEVRYLGEEVIKAPASQREDVPTTSQTLITSNIKSS